MFWDRWWVSSNRSLYCRQHMLGGDLPLWGQLNQQSHHSHHPSRWNCIWKRSSFLSEVSGIQCHISDIVGGCFRQCFPRIGRRHSRSMKSLYMMTARPIPVTSTIRRGLHSFSYETPVPDALPLLLLSEVVGHMIAPSCWGWCTGLQCPHIDMAVSASKASLRTRGSQSLTWLLSGGKSRLLVDNEVARRMSGSSCCLSTACRSWWSMHSDTTKRVNFCRLDFTWEFYPRPRCVGLR